MSSPNPLVPPCRAAASPRRAWINIALLLLVLVGTARIGVAQIIYGSIVGTVTDATGAVVPGASVKVVQTETNLVREVKTDSSGTYKLSTLPAGQYTVKVSHPGFSDQTLDGVTVQNNADARADAQLKVGTASASVTINASSASLQTDRAEVKSEISSVEIGNIPLAGRNYESLLRTVPGVNPPSDAAGDGSVNNPSRSLSFSGNGSSAVNSNTSIEGVSSANAWIQDLASYVPAQDAIENVDIVTGSFSAEQGTAGGISVNVQLKSGSNALHGTAFEQYTGSHLQTLPRFGFANAAARGLRNPQLVEHQFGGTLSGPILKNKLFFLFSAEALSDHETQVGNFFVPTIPNRQGYFLTSGPKIFDPNTGASDGSGRSTFATVTNPSGCVGCPAGTYYYVPSSRWDQATKQFLALIPMPTNPDPTITNGNFTAIGPYRYSLTKYDTKADYNFSSKFHVSGRLSLSPFTEIVPSAYGAAGGPPVSFTGQPGTTTGNVYSSALSGVYSFSQNLVLDANVGFTYLKTNQAPPFYGQNYGTDTLKIPNANGPDPINSGVPQFQLNGYFPWFGTWYSAIANHNPNHTIQANLTWVRGNHSMRFGGNYSKVDLNIAEDLFGYSFFDFNGGATSSNGVGGGFSQVNTLADYLLGEASQVQKRILNTTYSSLRTSSKYIYAQDQWQVSKKLTINYGVRWNYFPVPVRAHSGIELFNPLTDTNAICGRGSLASNCGISVSRALFSPLVGIAYRLDDKSVLRAGGGINFNQDNMFRDGLENYPSQTSYSVQQTNGYLPQQLVSTGLPLIPHPDLTQSSYVLPAGVLNQSNLLPGHFTRGYTESWNMTIQRDLGWGWSGQVGYVASHVVHGQVQVNLNRATTLGTQNPVTGIITNATCPYCSTPFGNNSYNVETSLLSSNYNSLQTELKHNFAHGLSVNANYTWSKHMGSNPSYFVPQYYSLNYSLQGDDRTHKFNLNLVGELPFGKGKAFVHEGLGAAILGGWQVGATLLADSGTPLTISANNNFGSSGIGGNWADKIKAGSPKGNRTIDSSGNINNYFDYSYFADPTTDCSTFTATGFCPARFGNAGINSVRGPGLFDTDANLSRVFPVWERVKLKFTADVFNLTNTPHLNNPSTNISNVGVNPSTGSPSNPNGIGQITGVTAMAGRFGIDQRQIKFGAHISF